ncbi:unnamed protein product [Clonostachys rosea]|uniref:Kelch repeat protein n=1 Tax=Bionectria ochroleuca TaxID=29856 RepID=A0ABY6UIP5_BIOOC|nr:unnamed protein product [Clonostachys rosea]
MYSKAISVLVVVLSVCAISAHAGANVNLKRRNFHSVAVLGDWLYIEGGSYSSWFEKGLTDRVAINSTYALPLTQPWMNGSVIFRETAYNGKVQTVDQFGLWTDGNNKMYKWAGSSTNRSKVEDTYKKTLYEFTVDGNGGGTWREKDAANPDTFADLRVTRQGAAASCKGMGYYMGGASSYWTESGVSGEQDGGWFPAPGLLTYEMGTGKWENISTDGYSMDGPMINGRGHCIEGFGSDPLIMFLGGGVSSMSTGKQIRQNSLSDLSFYNPVKRKWLQQPTSTSASPFGSAIAPDSRSQFCLTGARGKNGTYEIFVYGGYNDRLSTDLDDVWILSLPAFRWFRVPSSRAPARRYHDCATIGKSQMISVGGAIGDNAFSNLEQWPNGIGILDMNTGNWVDSYNPDAGDYETPSFIQQYYQESDYSARVNWADDADFKSSFSGLKIANTTSDESKDDTNNENNNPNKNIGAIIGGVLGGTALITLILAIAWFMYQRRRPAPEPELPRDEPKNYYYGSDSSFYSKSASPETAYSTPVYPTPVYEIHDAQYGRPNVVEPMRRPTPPPAEMVGV